MAAGELAAPLIHSPTRGSLQRAANSLGMNEATLIQRMINTFFNATLQSLIMLQPTR